MPGKKVKKSEFTTSNVGRPQLWSKAQQDVIDEALPAWYEYSMVENKDLEGRDIQLMAWKKKEAERLLSLPVFSELPSGVSGLN